MMLIYSKEREAGLPREQVTELMNAHWSVMQEATSKGILLGAEPLGPTTTATTVRVQNGKAMITDGPFAETKEQLAGYYMLECKNLDEALDWAAKIPTGCKGAEGCIEVRPLPGLPVREGEMDCAAAVNA
jgi:hypothetical protein